jgi:uncharacterized oxidoreductase
MPGVGQTSRKERIMKTSGNTVLITGGGSGIGLALAELMLKRGNTVIICGRRDDRLKAAKKRLPGLNIRVCDISKTRARAALLTWLTSRFKGLNILVNNAGIQRPIDFLKGRRHLSDADEEVATNLTAPIHLSALLVPHLRRKKEAAIVNISSGLAFTPLAAVPVYCATKAAFHSLSMSLRHQLSGTPVRVFEVAPPMVATELSGRRHRPDEQEGIMTPQAVAAGILDAIENGQYEVALGAAAHLKAKREALFPVINQ